MSNENTKSDNNFRILEVNPDEPLCKVESFEKMNYTLEDCKDFLRVIHLTTEQLFLYAWKKKFVNPLSEFAMTLKEKVQ